MTKKKVNYSIRMFINDIHLWLGLGSGIILFLVCLTGTILTFEEEIKSQFAKDFVISASDTDRLPITTLSSSLEREGDVSRVSVSNDPTKPYHFLVKEDPKQRRGTTYLVDPYNGDFEKEAKSAADEFFSTMFRLHRWLLLDTKIGRPIVGVATIIFLFLAISGIVLWFPKKVKWRNLKPGLKIKFTANWKRINHDLHNTLGFYASIFLVIMTLSGLCWSFDWYKDLGSTVLGTRVFGNRGGGPEYISKVDESKQISYEELIAIASSELDYAGTTTINLTKSKEDVIAISKKATPGFFTADVTDKLILDRDGTVLSKEIFSEKPINEQIAALIKPLHTGTIFGTFSKIIYFLACIIATSLPITGTLIWWNKLQKKRKKRKKNTNKVVMATVK